MLTARTHGRAPRSVAASSRMLAKTPARGTDTALTCAGVRSGGDCQWWGADWPVSETRASTTTPRR
ncbi:transcription-repair-coupling factor [Streptomyces azureus]|uniref:Transcription-repair-coupling factor n=1 Tax=Streptomyces azureus TaxID=146537 RepID=A0A0K8PUZ4_STRAJ|nr:transcription-repair-coupling factor [Streptomyces azureus]